jgi:putative peptide zinc metalloprotease protein
MTATVQRPAATIAPAAPRSFARAEGLELLGDVSGSGYRDGVALARRGDGQMVQLGPLMYALLEAIDGRRDHDELAAAMSERLGRRVEAAHVVRLGEKLAQQGLLAGSEDKAPPRPNPLLALRWKVLVTDPSITQRLTAPFVHMFRSWVLLPVLAGFAVVSWFVLIHKGVASATAQAFGNPELLLLVIGLGVASAAFHEIGHASACRFGGGRPGGMGAGIYMVWPAFYTDVTDAYRLPRRARLRTDFGGLYFNAVIAVITLAVWLATRTDALLLLIAIQMLEMVRNLSPVIRADGYHILSDATGVPDLYAHIGPTLRRLLPWRRREPSALTGRAQILVTAWVLVIVPVLLSMALSAILLLPKLAASTWESGSHIASVVPDQLGDGEVLPLLASFVRLFALALPVVGTILMVQRLVRSTGGKAWRWSAGNPARKAALSMATGALVALLAWAWWPAGQYQPVRASDDGTLLSAFRSVDAPVATARPAPIGAVAAPAGAPAGGLAPGKHLAVALIPQGGPTEEHPALFVIKGHGEKPTVVVSDTAPSTRGAPTLADPTTASPPAPTAPAPAATLPFKLPKAPGPNDSQALATNTTDGGITYDVAYSLVTVQGGDKVDETNSAYALASCNACTTIAVSFQIVLIVGQSDTITPINVAEALNLNCPSCITVAIAHQIVVSLSAVPSDELLRKLTAALEKLNAIEQLGTGGSPAEVAQRVAAVRDEIQQELDSSGLRIPSATATPAPAAPSATTTPSASPTATATPSPETTATPEPTATETPTPTDTPAPTPTAEAPAPTETPTP